MSKHWDMIVVGAGSAGAALAARSADKGKRVLLLEAGLDYRSAQMPPVWRSPNPMRALLEPSAGDSLKWENLTASRTDNQEPSLFWRGRGVGGSSAINGQIAIRPPMEDFDTWASWGCEGLARDEVLPYLNRLEDDQEFGDAPYHGRGGPTPIYRTPQSEWGAVDKALVAAGRAAGFPWAPDLNAPGATGVSPYPINSSNHQRVSTNDAYLEPRRNNELLTIWGGSLVERVRFEGDRAVGVDVVRDGSALSVFADEIVISAGAIHSPAILMRSGIGPMSDLERLGIEVRNDLPVGVGLQDHPTVFVQIPLREEAAAKTPDDRHTNVTIRYTSDDPSAQFNDLMIVAGNQNVLAMEHADVNFGAGAFYIWVNQVYSRGTVRLVSSDAGIDPQVQMRMLSDPRDLSRMRSGVRTAVELTNSAAVEAITLGAPNRLDEGLMRVIDDDADLDRYLLEVAADAQHTTSTCRMGPASDPASVVDSRCQVHGEHGLYVVDASIFPSAPRANTNLVTIMIGELMADRLG
ncbi:GMC family oxidoreductase [Nocardia testacea]|uniref:GMC family oxidoreductase n=1 Tax=Nocardia testacea TaxID=248551 RepID=UPI003A83D869